MPEFKLLLKGEGGVGKEEYLERLSARMPAPVSVEDGYAAPQEIGPDYPFAPTPFPAEVHPLTFYTSQGPTKFNFWDTVNNDERFGSLRDGYYMHSKCAIIMFDVYARITYKNVPNWHRDLTRVCGDIPIAICGNVGRAGGRREFKPDFHRRKINTEYFEISTYENSNCLEPLLWIAKKLSGDDQLRFMDFDPNSFLYRFFRVTAWREALLHWRGLTDAEMGALAILGNPASENYHKAANFVAANIAEGIPPEILGALAAFLSEN